MYVGITTDLVQEAVDMVKPTIVDLLRSGRTGEWKSLFLVVGLQGLELFLWEESFGEPRQEWKYPFDKIAKEKAKQCMRTGMTGRTLFRDAPWLIKPGDTRYVGGVYDAGLVVAASGLQDHFDEMIARMILAAIQGLCRDEISKIQDDDPDFFGA
jgi:hypothetical protein